jgi:ribonuclease BN (tRNA processing enzyme)
MTEHVLAAYQEDIGVRTNAMGLGFGHLQPEAYKVHAHEIKPGVVYKDANATVTAFPTKHAFTETYGYRFDTSDRSIVISGDTNPTDATIEACHGCDVLIHEVLTQSYLAKRPEFQAYAAKYHTTTTQLAQLAGKAKPGLLILYHHSVAFRPGIDSRLSSPEDLLNEVRSGYSGRVVVGRDLDVY